MILHQQSNIGGFAGATRYFWPTQPIIHQTVCQTSGAPPVVELAARRRSLIAIRTAGFAHSIILVLQEALSSLELR